MQKGSVSSVKLWNTPVTLNKSRTFFTKSLRLLFIHLQKVSTELYFQTIIVKLQYLNINWNTITIFHITLYQTSGYIHYTFHKLSSLIVPNFLSKNLMRRGKKPPSCSYVDRFEFFLVNFYKHKDEVWHTPGVQDPFARHCLTEQQNEQTRQFILITWNKEKRIPLPGLYTYVGHITEKTFCVKNKVSSVECVQYSFAHNLDNNLFLCHLTVLRAVLCVTS